MWEIMKEARLDELPAAPDEKCTEIAESIHRYFKANPNVNDAFLDHYTNTSEALCALRHRELQQCADRDPRPLRHYIVVMSKQILRAAMVHLETITRYGVKKDDFAKLQGLALLLKYIDDCSRKRRTVRSAVRKPADPSKPKRPRGRPRKPRLEDSNDLPDENGRNESE